MVVRLCYILALATVWGLPFQVNDPPQKPVELAQKAMVGQLETSDVLPDEAFLDEFYRQTKERILQEKRDDPITESEKETFNEDINRALRKTVQEQLKKTAKGQSTTRSGS